MAVRCAPARAQEESARTIGDAMPRSGNPAAGELVGCPAGERGLADQSLGRVCVGNCRRHGYVVIVHALSRRAAFEGGDDFGSPARGGRIDYGADVAFFEEDGIATNLWHWVGPLLWARRAACA
jgi:hypothetical protein